MNDQEYWELYYEKYKLPQVPSLFACHCLENYLNPGDRIIELGCGNCRDSLFFAKKGMNVLAVDQCHSELNYLKQVVDFPNLRLLCSDFSALTALGEFDVVYSRFTLHSINEEAEARVLDWSVSALKPGGYFLIEARGLCNELYQLGEAVTGEPDAFIYEGHYRRFLSLGRLGENLKAHGFGILQAQEQKGYAPYAGEDECFLRIIALKL